MIGSIMTGVVAGAVSGGIAIGGWAYYDVVVNHKDMFGFAAVYGGIALGALFGGVLGGIAAFIAEGRSRARDGR